MTETTKLKLTDAAVQRASLPAGRSDFVIWDAEVSGFGVRMRPGGKTWIVAYRPAGKGRSGQFKRMKLGAFPTLGTKDARTLARVTLGKVAAGSDPLQQRRVLKRRERTTFSEIIDRYDMHLEKRGYVNRRTVVAGLRGKFGRFSARDISDVSSAELIAALDAPGGSSFRPRAKAFFAWAVSTARLIPVIRAHKHAHAAYVAARDRAWSLTELVDPDLDFSNLDEVRAALTAHYGADASTRIDELLTAQEVNETLGDAEDASRTAFETLPIRTSAQLAAIVAYAKADATTASEGVEVVEVVSLWHAIDRLATALATFLAPIPAEPVTT